MPIRLSCGVDNQPATLEHFNHGNLSGIVVRWDFQKMPISQIDVVNTPLDSGRKLRNPQQTESWIKSESDCDVITFSQECYFGRPDPDQVIADIERDLQLRYAGESSGKVDIEKYRAALAALNM